MSTGQHILCSRIKIQVSSNSQNISRRLTGDSMKYIFMLEQKRRQETLAQTPKHQTSERLSSRLAGGKTCTWYMQLCIQVMKLVFNLDESGSFWTQKSQKCSWRADTMDAEFKRVMFHIVVVWLHERSQLFVLWWLCYTTGWKNPWPDQSHIIMYNVIQILLAQEHEHAWVYYLCWTNYCMNAGEAFGGFGNAPQEIRPQGGTEPQVHITKTE